MRLMAGFAGNPVRVIGGIDLRKLLGLGRTRRVTPRAKYCRIQLHRCYRRRIVGVLCQRPVARLAIHVRMLALALHIEHVAMAGFAGLMTGKLHRTGRNLTDRIAAIVAVLSEAFGNHVTSDDKKDNEGENKEPRESE